MVRKSLPIMASNFLIFTLIIISSSLLTIQTKGEFVTTVDRELAEVHKEKKSFFHFYFHDIHNDPNATSVGIVSSPLNTSTTNFGSLDMIDNPLTEGPYQNSTLVGRAQGIYGSASLDYDGLLMAMNLVFLEGKYNGSYLTVVGRNKVADQVRELPVVGGSGLFRFARGYCLVSTYEFNATAGGIIAEFNVTALHY